jgi:hypothetical protein
VPVDIESISRLAIIYTPYFHFVENTYFDAELGVRIDVGL